MADQPTTIFNFGPVLDAIRADVETIQSNYVTVNRFNQILAHIDAQSLLIQNNTTAIATLGASVSNFTNLLEALIQALTGVATEALQLQEIALLEQLVPPPHAEKGSFNPGSAVIT